MDNTGYDELLYERLLYRKQFIMMPYTMDGPSEWKKCGIYKDKLVLYAHPELDMTVVENENRRIVLLGYILDWQNPEFGNGDIIKMLLRENRNFESFLEGTFNLGGRFVLIYEDKECCRMYHDAAGQMEVYYYKGSKGLACGTQLPIMNRYIALENNMADGVQEFYRSEDFTDASKRWIGEDTIYNDTRKLSPNFYLDLINGELVRYWPVRPLRRRSLQASSEIACWMLKGFMNAISRRSKLIMPVTADLDSRLMLAATKDIRDRVTYYAVRYPWLDDESKDIRIPRSLFEEFRIPFKVLNPGDEADADFGRAFMDNTAYPIENNIPETYNIFYKMFNDSINITSQVSETIRNYCGTIKTPNGRLFSTHIGYDGNNEYAARMCDKWLKKNSELAKEMNIDLLSLFIWEEGLNWEASQRTQADIAIEEYSPFSCRNLLETMLSVNDSYRNKYNCILYRRMIEIMWPEILYEPINPSFKGSLKGVLVSMDMFYSVKKIFKGL